MEYCDILHLQDYAHHGGHNGFSFLNHSSFPLASKHILEPVETSKIKMTIYRNIGVATQTFFQLKFFQKKSKIFSEKK